MFGFIISVFVFFNYTCGIWCSRVLIRSVCPTVWIWRRAVEVTTMHDIGRAECEDQRGMDVTPFLTYFIENVYHKLVPVLLDPDTTEIFQNALPGQCHGKGTGPVAVCPH